MSQNRLGCKGSTSKKNKQLKQMALFSAIVDVFVAKVRKEVQAEVDTFIEAMRKKISLDADGSGDMFVAKITKQIASDYNLDYTEIKSRYCGKSSFAISEPAAKPAPEPIPEPVVYEPISGPPASSKPKKVSKKQQSAPPPPPIPEPVLAPEIPAVSLGVLMAFSKMKKGDLVSECERRGIDSDGTIAQLKERVKEARSTDTPSPKKTKGPSKPRAVTAKKKVPAAAVVVAAVPPPVKIVAAPLLEEEEEEDNGEADLENGDSLQDRLQRHECDDDECTRAIEHELDEDEEETSSLSDRLRKILADAGSDEEDKPDEIKVDGRPDEFMEDEESADEEEDSEDEEGKHADYSEDEDF